MSKNPEFNPTMFCLNGFIKTYPILAKSDPREVGGWLYGTVSAFSGRNGRSIAGGGEDDILCLVAAAADVEIEVCAAREIKDTLRDKLRVFWLENNHAAILYAARGFERNAAMAVIDYRDVDWVDPYRIVEEGDEEDGNEVSEVVEEWVEVLCEPSVARSVIGNRTRKKLRRKPAERAVKSLFEGV